MHDVPKIILAGGQSSRMGMADKALVDLNGATLLQHCLDRLSKQSGTCGPIALNINGPHEPYAPFQLPLVPDDLSDFQGPLAGILAGMEWAHALGYEAVITIAVDTPFFPTGLTSRLAATSTPSQPSVAAAQDASGTVRVHPVFGCWPVALRADLRAHLKRGHRKLYTWAERHGAQPVVFDAPHASVAHGENRPLEPFFNINTPDDLARAARSMCGE